MSDRGLTDRPSPGDTLIISLYNSGNPPAISLSLKLCAVDYTANTCEVGISFHPPAVFSIPDLAWSSSAKAWTLTKPADWVPGQ